MIGGLGEGGSLGPFICMQPVEIFGYDLVQCHIHIYNRAVSTGAKWGWRNVVYLFERLENDSMYSAD